MSKLLCEKHRLAKAILHELSRQPLGRSRLERKTILHCSSHSKFESLFAYLLESGFIEKTGEAHRAPYRLTEKGCRFLEGLS
jgi:predicted transcriptional regulator